jgi:hypothetical protein
MMAGEDAWFVGTRWPRLGDPRFVQNHLGLPHEPWGAGEAPGVAEAFSYRFAGPAVLRGEDVGDVAAFLRLVAMYLTDSVPQEVAERHGALVADIDNFGTLLVHKGVDQGARLPLPMTSEIINDIKSAPDPAARTEELARPDPELFGALTVRATLLLDPSIYPVNITVRSTGPTTDDLRSAMRLAIEAFRRGGARSSGDAEGPVELRRDWWPLQYRGTFSVSADEFGEVARKALVEAGFTVYDADERSCSASLAGSRRPYSQTGRATIAWTPAEADAVDALWAVTSSLPSAPDLLADALRRYVETAPPPRTRREIIAPGELHALGENPQFDFGGLQPASALEDLRHGVVPLGRWGFRADGHRVEHGPLLWVPARHLRQGVVLCAPPGMGKTHLLVRWAVAARAAGYSVFLVDVKGDMIAEYGDELGRDDRNVFWFTTDPKCFAEWPDVPWCRINFLEGLWWHPSSLPPGIALTESNDVSWAETVAHIGDIVEIVLPPQSAVTDPTFYGNRVRWLTGMIELLVLHQLYRPDRYPNRSPDLHDLWQLVGDESKVRDALADVAAAEAAYAEARRAGKEASPEQRRLRMFAPYLPPIGSDDIRRTIALLLDQPSDASRTRQSYAELTHNIQTALEPFGFALKAKVRDVGRGRLLSLEDVFTGTQPMTVVFAARDSDGPVADLVLGMSVRRLGRLVTKRLHVKDRVPMLLLLDEASRIPAFDPNRYVAFNRAADAGAVLAYQDTMQIGGDDDVAQLLGATGVQIYLGSVPPNARDAIVRHLGSRPLVTSRRTATLGPTGRTRTEEELRQEIPVVGPTELARLDFAGDWPALVVINPLTPGSRRRATLVDMDETC